MLSRDEPAEPTLGEFMEDWFRRDAVPNLAPNTIAAYLPTYRNHIRALPVDPRQPDDQTFGELALSQFAEPYVHHDFRASLRLTGRSKPTQDAARKVLSSALSWGVESRIYRRWLPANGAKLATTRRRRANRAAARRTQARPPRSRVLNAFDYELVRAELIARTGQRTWEPYRDAALLDLVFGCGLRPEEARGTRWWQVLWPDARPRASGLGPHLCGRRSAVASRVRGGAGVPYHHVLVARELFSLICRDAPSTELAESDVGGKQLVDDI